MADHGGAVHVGHHHIGDDEMDLGAALDDLQRFFAAAGFQHIVAAHAQGARRKAAHRFLVLDQQNGVLAGDIARRGRGFHRRASELRPAARQIDVEAGALAHLAVETPAARDNIDEALGRLASASLLTFSTDDATVAAHRLTMRVATERQAQQGTLANSGAGAAALLVAVTESLSEPWQNRAAARDAIQQIMALHEHLTPYLSDQDAELIRTLLELRGWVLWCLNDLGDSFAQAIEYGQDLVSDREQVLGQAHPDTLTSRNNLASAYQDAGRLDEAIPLYERTLADCERVLGDDHPDTLTSRNNLARAYQAAGRLDEAIPLFERTLADSEQVLGDTHPDTLASRNNLASAYQAAGRLDEAIPLFERTLADREQVLGQTHPDTLTSRNNLAGAYQAAGRLDEAIPLYERTLADREQVLGQTHPDTLTSRNNLASAYQAAGRLDEAIPLYERTLADREQVLGDTHPDTLAPATTSPAPTRTPGGWTRPSRCTSAPSPTASRSWATTTPTP